MPSKLTVKLTGIDIRQILNKQFMNDKNIDECDENLETHVILSDIDENNDNKNKNNDKMYEVSSLSHSRSKKAMKYTDFHKHKAKVWVNMIDIYYGGALPRATTKKCWGNCRSKFKNEPIGCPIKYHHISPDNNTKIAELDRQRIIELLKTANLPTDTTDFYETEGIFCSFNCAKGYILQKLAEGHRRYQKSLSLLSALQITLIGKLSPIESTSSWKLLKEWGGHLDAKELRASVGKLVYVEKPIVRRPWMYSSASYIKEIRK